MRIAMMLALWTCLFSMIAACGGSEPSPPTEPGPGDAEPTSGGEQEPAADAPVPWAQRTHEQRAEFMNEVVVPQMKVLFQEFDSQEFARFGCPTCHGANGREVQFRMPNGLHPLNPAAMPSPDSANADEARWMRFMMQEVVPKMADLLGEPRFDPATGQGFGCFDCHARQP